MVIVVPIADMIVEAVALLDAYELVQMGAVQDAAAAVLVVATAIVATNVAEDAEHRAVITAQPLVKIVVKIHAIIHAEIHA